MIITVVIEPWSKSLPEKLVIEILTIIKSERSTAITTIIIIIIIIIVIIIGTVVFHLKTETSTSMLSVILSRVLYHQAETHPTNV
jgi:amino acid transporter